jgi:hypothetical protein
MNKEAAMDMMYQNMMDYVINRDKKEEENFKIRQCDLVHFLSSYYVYVRFNATLTDFDLQLINNANYEILLKIDEKSEDVVELKQNIDRTLSLVV